MNAINSSWSWLGESVLQRKAADWLAWPLIVLVKTYQIVISPLFPRSCRFTPTCSSYAVEALKKHGIFKGLGLMISRIVRCRPGNPGGYDPVP